ncbi:MAG: glycosyltransferase [Prevotellaceae bacterium]|jgi:glycosyltransferase involved in cell wall biosynthesis|nr:glycosyltransferase [Prevotellaceae bacterium]
MKVSVIIPVYNVSAYIERCLLSALNQTWSDLEIIVVDDCTPDDSMQIAKRVTETHPRGDRVIFLAHQTNRGQSAARNSGIRIATGRYLFFLDSDDYLPLHCIETLWKAASTGSYQFVLGNYEITGQARAVPYLNMPTGALASNEAILAAYAHDLWPRTVWNMLIDRRFLLKENLYFEENLIHEDDLWTFFLACRAQSAYMINQVTYYYYTHTHSTTGSPSLWNLECRVRIIGIMYNSICASPSLLNNRYVYRTFETAKMKYFDRILYFNSERSFRYNSYLTFRQCTYRSVLSAMCRFRPGFKLMLSGLHYYLPVGMGYRYYCLIIRTYYYLLIASLKIKQLIK